MSCFAEEVKRKMDRYYRIETGDCLESLRTMPDQSVHCCVTSPPYFGLRDYGVAGQIGAEKSPAEFVAALVAVFAEVRRVLADDGTCWLNLGDSYSTRKVQRDSSHQPGMHAHRTDHDTIGRSWVENRKSGAVRMPSDTDRPEKNLLGIPWRCAFALQDDGWILRNEIIWAKPNGMPESVTDRLSTKHEHLFLLTKSRRYHFNLNPIREQPVTERPDALTWARDEQGVPGQKPQHRPHRQGKAGEANLLASGQRHAAQGALGKNPGDVWTIPTQPFSGAHFATFPPEIPRRCIAAGAKPGSTVLDPFSGSGTTGLAAGQLGHPYIGIDLSAEYLDLSLRTRLAQSALTDEGQAS